MFLHFVSILCTNNSKCCFKSPYNNIQLAIMLTLLMVVCGSVHPNPGPDLDGTCLKLCHVNMRSLIPGDRSIKIDELYSTLCMENKFDLICVTETWLDNSITDECIAIPDYQIFRKDRNRHGGGVAMYAHNSLPIRYLPQFDLNDLELVCVEVKLQSKSIIVGCCYRPPSSRAEGDVFLENFQNVLNLMFVNSPDSLFILGDFNDRCFSWEDNHNASDLGLKFRDQIENNILFQIIRDPTYITENYTSLLDLIITDSPGYVLDSGVGNPIGDPHHCYVFCKLCITYCKDVKYHRGIWLYNNANIDDLNNALSLCPWDVLDIFDDIEDMADYFTSLFLETCKQFITFKDIIIRPQDKPWMTQVIRKKLRERNRLHKRWKSTGRADYFANYQQKRNETNEVIKTAKSIHYDRIKERLCNPDIGAKEYWKLLKLLYGSKIDSGIPSIIDGERVFSTSKDKAELFNDHFIQKTALPADLPPLPPLHMCESELSHIDISEEEVRKILQNLNVSKANGADNISNRLLKMTATQIAKPLSKLFKESLFQGKFPSMWKEANVTPVFKKNDKQNKSNYRPISLLPNIGKVFERVIFIHLYKYCQDNNLLTWRNSGYKPLDSSINQLIFISHKIYQALEKGEDICFVSLDVSSAFDRVWHEGLLFKLRSKGINGKLLEWFRSYLTNRRQRVVIKGQASKWAYILAGVPQGSILGPLLFLIYIDDIINDIESNILLFADDTSLLEAISDPLLSYEKLNRDLTRLYLWSNQWLVTFNPTKTAYIVFSKKLIRPNHPDLFLGGKKIEQVNIHKQLGVTFNQNMTFENHIRSNCTKAMKRVTVLKRLNAKIPRKSKLTVYTAFIRPVLEFGWQLYDNSTQEQLDTLERVQQEALLIVTSAYKKTSHTKLLKEVGLPLLSKGEKCIKYNSCTNTLITT